MGAKSRLQHAAAAAAAAGVQCQQGSNWNQVCKCTALQCTGSCTVYHPAALQVGNQCLQKCIVQMCTLCVLITGFDSCAEQFAPIQSDVLVVDRLKEFLAVSFLFCF